MILVLSLLTKLFIKGKESLPISLSSKNILAIGMNNKVTEDKRLDFSQELVDQLVGTFWCVYDI